MENNLNKIRIVFSSNEDLKKLNKEEIIFREEFLSKLQQKFDFSLLDLNNLSISIKENDIISVSSFNKNDLNFIFLENMGDSKNIMIFYDEKLEKFMRKNKGVSFIVLKQKKSSNYNIINSKDYFDLFIKHDDQNKILISDFKEMPFLKKVRNLLFK